MKPPNRITKVLLEVGTIFLLILVLTGPAAAQTIFSDNFNRSDGPVGNGWSSWWDGVFESPNTSLVNGELRTYGYNGQAGGIFRSLPLTLPITISFDFRTLSQGECVTGHNDGGWLFVLNGAPVTSPPAYNTNSQVEFYQYHGAGNIGRSYLTAGGRFDDGAPNLPDPIPGQRDYTATPAHIEGTINPDLSATFTIHYNDGLTPDPVTISFGPAVGVVNSVPGSMFVLSNSNCSSGPHFFDNLEIRALQTVLTVTIDIKPGEVHNSINPRSSGVIPVAILTTGSFDATTIDPTTVRFGAGGTEAASAHFALEDVNGDGRLDMILQFRTQDTGIVCGTASASLTGKTSGGQAIRGSDSVNTVGCK
ncbi:MAG TPA: hypothetical protein VKB86_04400 [Pyrinomonadaceae bacterium]|nr:hypothetical protein [Pyrinomonadaceae bacterium]